MSTSVENSTAVLVIDNPPVNMGNTAMRTALLEAITALEGRTDVLNVVITTAGRHFYAGSDIAEFDGPPSEPQLPAVIAALEALPVPVVAAITGLALGGGLEFALGCDARVGDTSARVGFPEVTLGFLPGAGGTVRTPRLTGIPKAIDLIATARQIDADEALSLGILDRVVPPDELLDAAIAYARSMPAKRLVRDLPLAPAARTQIDAAVALLPKRSRPNILEAVALIEQSAHLSGPEALVLEREAFHRLRVSDEATNLRYLFFARRAAAKDLRTTASPRKVRSVGIAGAGTMGSSLARAFAAAGYDVTVYDPNAAAVARVNEITGVSGTDALSGLAKADLVVDAVFEDMQVKTALFREIEEHVRADTILVSNTSYLDLAELSRSLAKTSRFAGLHFFNPADRNPLVEVIRAPHTDDATIATLSVVVSRLGKTPISAGMGDGFVANRIYAAYRSQAEFLVQDGASPQQVDAALISFGFPIGPFAVGDLSGLNIAWSRHKRLAATRDPRQRYVTIADQLCELGRFGKKSGSGWYRYGADQPRGVPDPRTDALIQADRVAHGISPRDIDDEEIRSRIFAAMLCAAASLMQSGTVQRASDIDVALTEGFAFPRHVGGPIRHLARMPHAELVDTLAATYRSCSITFAIAAPAVNGELPEAISVLLRQVAP
ncbi:3-hydroxyacyl-CoA dehydrogenase NAD-binding domain-containing protein [Cryobacterium glaciale]|uniref:3-hydroxyacyl-CoA dehydrogenase NAD-binding domain-containing protein n=1 Tax=Cryobacterium glaciale TaxID=1259145 RepID=UPI002104BDC0|nr:3-hydroxyacyl-CoA dehydrogenase NAD-binding domain-containing protein [Cryobacterium glaciale]